MPIHHESECLDFQGERVRWCVQTIRARFVTRVSNCQSQGSLDVRQIPLHVRLEVLHGLEVWSYGINEVKQYQMVLDKRNDAIGNICVRLQVWTQNDCVATSFPLGLTQRGSGDICWNKWVHSPKGSYSFVPEFLCLFSQTACCSASVKQRARRFAAQCQANRTEL